MVLSAPDAVTDVRPVHWTSFSAVAVPVDWSDHHVAHKTVMRMFDPNLGETARAEAGVLFRADASPAGLNVFVQSLVAPMFLPAGARQLTFDDASWAIPKDAVVRFRVAINPIARNGRLERVLDLDESEARLGSQLAGILDDVDVVNVARSVHVKRIGRASSRSAGDKMTTDTFDAVARVVDADAFSALRRIGLGRRKSYGCGLLTAQRIG